MLRVVAGDWRVGPQVHIRRNKGISLAEGGGRELIPAAAIARLEVLVSATSPEMILLSPAIRAAANAFFASHHAKHGLVLLEVKDARWALIEPTSSLDHDGVAALLRAIRLLPADADAEPSIERQPISALWRVGIVVAPVLCVWLLFRPRHSWAARAFGLAWTAVFSLTLLGALLSTPGPSTVQDAAASLSATTRAKPTAEQQATFLEKDRAFRAAAAGCDAAWASMTKALAANDRFRSYDAAEAGKEVCRQAAIKILDVDFSAPIQEPTRSALNSAMQRCSMSVQGESTALDQAATMLNGDERPSALADFRNSATFAQEDAQTCSLQYLSAAVQGGYAVPAPAPKHSPAPPRGDARQR